MTKRVNVQCRPTNVMFVAPLPTETIQADDGTVLQADDGSVIQSDN